MRRAGWFGAAAALIASVASGLVWQTDSSASASAEASIPLDGAAVFRAKGCASCHTGPAPDGLTGSHFPELTDISEWASERRQGLSAEEYLVESIREPWAFMSPQFEPSGGPAAAMPQIRMSDGEVAAIVTFLLAG